jgi:hypothetical protein
MIIWSWHDFGLNIVDCCSCWINMVKRKREKWCDGSCMYTFVWMPCFLPILIHETTDSPNISIVHVHIWYQLQFATCGTQQLYQHNVEFVYTWYRIGKPPGKCVRWSHNTYTVRAITVLLIMSNAIYYSLHLFLYVKSWGEKQKCYWCVEKREREIEMGG